MRVLLDTHVLIWALGQPRRLPKDIQSVLQEPQNEIFFSAASIWEIAIKTQIGRVHFSVPPIEITRRDAYATLGSRCVMVLVLLKLETLKI